MVIDDFLRQYSRTSDHYEKVARVCADACEAGMSRQGVRAIVSARAKRHDRLREKLERRHANKPYTSTGDIYADIVDLAGVRIALYFPGDLAAVRRWVEATFDVEHVKDDFTREPGEGYRRIFKGYDAVHYRARLREGPGVEARLCDTRVEIQIASVLMHAWSEVEHDLIYKPLSGDVSVDEHAILDELNGLVLAGEIALQRLQRAIQTRVSSDDRPFQSRYDLAAFLESFFASGVVDRDEDMEMGRTDVLFRFLQLAHLDRPSLLRPHLQVLWPKLVEIVDELYTDWQDLPIAQVLSNDLFLSDPSLYETQYRATKDLSESQPFVAFLGRLYPPVEKDAWDYFLTRYLAFEGAVRFYLRQAYPGRTWAQFSLVYSSSKIFRDGLFAVERWTSLATAIMLRDHMVFADGAMRPEQVRQTADVFVRALEHWETKVSGEMRTQVEEALHKSRP